MLFDEHDVHHTLSLLTGFILGTIPQAHVTTGILNMQYQTYPYRSLKDSKKKIYEFFGFSIVLCHKIVEYVDISYNKLNGTSAVS